MAALEQKVDELETKSEERIRRLELSMLRQMEQMMLSMQAPSDQQLPSTTTTALQVDKNVSMGLSTLATSGQWGGEGQGNNRGTSISSLSIMNALAEGASHRGSIASAVEGPTLPPHPKQKQTTVPSFSANSMPAPANRTNSLRGLSTATRGVSGLIRAGSVESSSSAVLNGTTLWEDRMFSQIMLERGASETMAAAEPATVSEEIGQGPVVAEQPQKEPDADDMSDVSV